MNETAIAGGQDDRVERFVEYLEKLHSAEDRAALAALRRSLGKTPGEAAEAHRYVLHFHPAVWEEPAYYLVAGLFALHPASWRREAGDKRPTNFGASFAWLRSNTDSDSIERRFVALLDCHENDLAEHLRHAVSLLRSKEIPVNWAQLLKDLRNWNHEDRFAQRSWARSFWGSSQSENKKSEAE
jgi:CRISPR system Cascade subunit CasB